MMRAVWFMRQAGRYLKQYREIRAKHGILEICKRPDLAAAVTLQPVEISSTWTRPFIFADLLLPVEVMGLKLRFAAGEGTDHREPVRTSSDGGLPVHFQYGRSGLCRRSNSDRRQGFCWGQSAGNRLRGSAPSPSLAMSSKAAPSRSFLRTKQMMYSNETLWRRLMGKLVDVLGAFAV